MSYKNCVVSLNSKHRKELAIGPAFEKFLSAKIQTCKLDTDKLGTFSGEIPREDTPLACAELKCRQGMEYSNSLYGLASEGTFGPHPTHPFIPCDHEILYFIDNNIRIHVKATLLSIHTNYSTKIVENFDDLKAFAERTLFPSHALIIRPNIWEDKKIIFKGLQTFKSIQDAFNRSQQVSPDCRVWVETDMRAHMNPSRMRVIGTLAEKLANQLNSKCPQCHSPGWGIVRLVEGLSCSLCDTPTNLIKHEILGCPRCEYQLITPRYDGLIRADPANCLFCNP